MHRTATRRRVSRTWCVGQLHEPIAVDARDETCVSSQHGTIDALFDTKRALPNPCARMSLPLRQQEEHPALTGHKLRRTAQFHSESIERSARDNEVERSRHHFVGERRRVLEELDLTETHDRFDLSLAQCASTRFINSSRRGLRPTRSHRVDAHQTHLRRMIGEFLHRHRLHAAGRRARAHTAQRQH